MEASSPNTAPPNAPTRDPRRLAMAASFGISFLMLIGKSVAFLLTGSSAIFSDAAESVIHLVATGFAGFSLWYSVQPPDTGHPYGHGKIAYFSSGFEGGMIFIAACTIMYSAVRDLVLGAELRQLGLGLLIVGGLALVNLALGLVLVRVGRKHNSLVLVSNGQHVLSDMWTSLGVVVGVALVWLTGITWLDPVVAILVAANLGLMGLRLIRRSYRGLMERADESDSFAIIQVLDEAERNGSIAGYHQLRHRRINDTIWIEYHLQFDGGLTVTEAHDQSHAVEDAIAALFPGDQVVVTAHLEPDEHDESHPSNHAEPIDPLRDADLRS